MKQEQQGVINYFVQVLIGPCGIETDFSESFAMSNIVLIGPCGIETRKGYRCFFHDYVLIGPCGIETC